MFEKIKPLPHGIFIPKIVPLVYDDTLSYYEFVCKLMVKLEEIITAVNNLGIRVDALEEAVRQLQAIVNEFDTRITQNENDIRDIKGDIEVINGIIENVNNSITTINNNLDILNSDMSNVKNSINSINSAISDLRDTVSTLGELPEDVASLDSRVTILESATFGDITVSPVPKNLACNMMCRDSFNWEIVNDSTPQPGFSEYQIVVPDPSEQASQGVWGFRFRGNNRYGKSHLIIYDFLPEMQDSEVLTFMIKFNPAFSGLNYGQVKTTTFGNLKTGISLLNNGYSDVCVGGAKIVASSTNMGSYDLYLYAFNPTDESGYIDNSYYSLNYLCVISGSGYTEQGRIAVQEVEPYFNAYQFVKPGVTPSDFESLSDRVTQAENDIASCESDISTIQGNLSTFTYDEYVTDFNNLVNQMNGIQSEIDSENVETWVSFTDVFENSRIPSSAFVHHFRMDKKGRMVVFELGMLNLSGDSSTFRYLNYNLGQIRSGLRTKLAPAMNTPCMFTGMLSGTDNNNPDFGFNSSGSISASDYNNPAQPDVTGIATASLYGAVGDNFYSDMFPGVPPYSLIVSLHPWSVQGENTRNAFMIRGCYFTE